MCCWSSIRISEIEQTDILLPRERESCSRSGWREEVARGSHWSLNGSERNRIIAHCTVRSLGSVHFPGELGVSVQPHLIKAVAFLLPSPEVPRAQVDLFAQTATVVAHGLAAPVPQGSSSWGLSHCSLWPESALTRTVRQNLDLGEASLLGTISTSQPWLLMRGRYLYIRNVSKQPADLCSSERPLLVTYIEISSSAFLQRCGPSSLGP